MGNENSKVIFISYSHDNEVHRNRVAKLSERLRKDGLQTELDQYVNGTPEKGWPRWMLDKLDEATFVLVICTETYYRRFRGDEERGKGKGVDWEGALITQEVYAARSKTQKFVPVLFSSHEQSFIPEPLCGGTHYIIDSDENYQSLLDFLFGRAGIEPGAVGTPEEKQRRTVDPLRFDSSVGEKTEEGLNTDSTQHEKHIQFQNQIRTKIEKELGKEALKPLRDGFIEVAWSDAGKVGEPTIPELVNELFVIDQNTECVDSDALLSMLLRGTEACLVQLDDQGEKITESHIIWKTAKQILGWLTTLAVRSEALANTDNENGFDEIDVETLIGVEVYTARKKDIPADFQVDSTGNSTENFKGGKQIDPGFFPETGWQAEDVIKQIWLIIWKAVGNKARTQSLTHVELKQLNKTLSLHRTRRRNSLNYHLTVRKSVKHPLLIPDICCQIKAQLPELTIVHMGTETGNGELLMMDEGELVALIEEFLNLINQYQ